MRLNRTLTLTLLVLLLAVLMSTTVNFSTAAVNGDKKQKAPAQRKGIKSAFESGRPFAVINWDIKKSGQRLKNQPVVLFDQGHNQRFFINREKQLDLSGLARIFHDQGYKTAFTKGALTEENLRGVTALVVSGPFKPFTPEEEKTIIRWLHKGGRLSLMLHVAGPMLGFLEKLGISVSNGVIRETVNIINSNPLDFAVKDLNDHPITQGINSFNVFGCWALLNRQPTSTVLAQTGKNAWVDLDRDKKLGKKDAVQAFAVAIAGTIGRGKFVAFGDDTLFQNRFLSPENKSVARNMANWFMAD